MPQPETAVQILGDTLFTDKYSRIDGHVCLDKEQRKKLQDEKVTEVMDLLLKKDNRLCLMDIYEVATLIQQAIKKVMCDTVGPYNVHKHGGEIANELEKATVQPTTQPETNDSKN